MVLVFLLLFFSSGKPLRKQAHAIHVYRNYFCCKNENFHRKNFDIFLIFAQNVDCGKTLQRPWLTSFHNLCFGSKNKKKGKPLQTPANPSFTINYEIGGYTFHGHVFLMDQNIQIFKLLGDISCKLVYKGRI